MPLAELEEIFGLALERARVSVLEHSAALVAFLGVVAELLYRFRPNLLLRLASESLDNLTERLVGNAFRAEDLSGLPEAYVCVGGADGFRDEDITYAMRLYEAGVPAELHVYPGAPHGVAFFAETRIAQRYTADQEDWLGRQLDRLAP